MKIYRQDQLRKTIFKLLYYRGALSLAEISAYTNKSVPNITAVMSSLVEEGYAVESGLAPSTGGRRPLKYRLNSKMKKYILAVAMDQFITRIVLYNFANEVVFSERAFPIALSNNPAAFDELCLTIDRYIASSTIPQAQILGIGIGMPGFIDVEKGLNASFLTPPNAQASLRDELRDRLGLPVYIDNDSSAIAIAELHFGSAKDLKDVMVVNMGWGIGLGMIVNGSLFRGHNGYAGEFSHIPLSHSDKLCACGKRGCLEVEASLLVAVENAKQAIADGTKSSLQKLFVDADESEGDQLVVAAKEGDQLAISSLSDAAFLVGKGIATLIHIMNPERVVLSGRAAAAGKLLLAPIQRAINEFCIPKLAEQTEVNISSLGHQAELLGAASLVVEHLGQEKARPVPRKKREPQPA